MQQSQQNPQYNDKTQNSYIIKCKIEKFVICIDPDSEQIYGLNPQTNEVYIFLDEQQKQGAEKAIDNFQDEEELQNAKKLNALKENYLNELKNLQSLQQPLLKQSERNSKQLSISSQFAQLTTQISKSSSISQFNQTLIQQQQQINNLDAISQNNAKDIQNDESYTIQDYRRKGYEAIKNIEEITHLNKGNWLIQHERADQYRRRKLPNYLLQRTDQNHPTYICQSPLSEVFVDQKTITVQVNLQKFQIQLQAKYSVATLEVGLVTAQILLINKLLN